jgi:putative NIF3 family GTP cyclohydrolase 1 type 2
MVVAGTGFLFPELVDYCYKEGIDVLVSGDLIKKTAKRGLELGVALIDAGARETELPGMIALSKSLKDKGFDCQYYDVGDGYEYI